MTNLRALLAAATPGKWSRESGEGETDWIMAAAEQNFHVASDVEDTDADLIAALVNAAPLMLDVIEAAQAEVRLQRSKALNDALARLDALEAKE